MCPARLSGVRRGWTVQADTTPHFHLAWMVVELLNCWTLLLFSSSSLSSVTRAWLLVLCEAKSRQLGFQVFKAAAFGIAFVNSSCSFWVNFAITNAACMQVFPWCCVRHAIREWRPVRSPCRHDKRHWRWVAHWKIANTLGLSFGFGLPVTWNFEFLVVPVGVATGASSIMRAPVYGMRSQVQSASTPIPKSNVWAVAENQYTQNWVIYSISQKTWKQSLHGTEVKERWKQRVPT